MIDAWRWDHCPFTHVRGTLTIQPNPLDRLGLAAADEARTTIPDGGVLAGGHNKRAQRRTKT